MDQISSFTNQVRCGNIHFSFVSMKQLPAFRKRAEVTIYLFTLLGFTSQPLETCSLSLECNFAIGGTFLTHTIKLYLLSNSESLKIY